MTRKKEISDAYKDYIKTGAVGLEVGLSVIVGVVAGYFADRYFDVRPWGLIFGFVVGVLAAGKRLYMFVKRYLKEDEKNDRNRKPDA